MIPNINNWNFRKLYDKWKRKTVMQKCFKVLWNIIQVIVCRMLFEYFASSYVKMILWIHWHNVCSLFLIILWYAVYSGMHWIVFDVFKVERKGQYKRKKTCIFIVAFQQIGTTTKFVRLHDLNYITKAKVISKCVLYF